MRTDTLRLEAISLMSNPRLSTILAEMGPFALINPPDPLGGFLWVAPRHHYAALFLDRFRNYPGSPAPPLDTQVQAERRTSLEKIRRFQRPALRISIQRSAGYGCASKSPR